MSARTERITAAISGLNQRIAAKDTQISELARAGDELRAALTEKLRELADTTSARDRLQEFVETEDWGELASGAAIKAGDIVRFGALRYSARIDHSKALTRSPINLIYWQPITD